MVKDLPGRTPAPEGKPGGKRARKVKVQIVGKLVKTEMDDIPNCDFCVRPAKYDAATVGGPWAYMCEKHFLNLGTGKLGMGHGQELVKRETAS